MVDQKDSTSALSTEEATRPIEPSSPAARSRWPNSHDVYWVPLSAWTIVPGCGQRCQRAICRASTTSSVRMRSAMDQPMTRLE